MLIYIIWERDLQLSSIFTCFGVRKQHRQFCFIDIIESMSWILNTIVVSALIIMILHCAYEYLSDREGAQTPDLADLKTRQYKAIIEKMIKEKEDDKGKDDDKEIETENELTEYMKSKIVE